MAQHNIPSRYDLSSANFLLRLESQSYLNIIQILIPDTIIRSLISSAKKHEITYPPKILDFS